MGTKYQLAPVHWSNSFFRLSEVGNNKTFLVKDMQMWLPSFVAKYALWGAIQRKLQNKEQLSKGLEIILTLILDNFPLRCNSRASSFLFVRRL